MIRISSFPLFTILFSFFCFSNASAQNSIEISDNYVKKNLHQYKLSKSDIKDWIITDNYVSNHNGVNHIYYQQTYEGIPIENALINVNVLQDGNILTWNSRFVNNVKNKANGVVSIQANVALQASLAELNITPKKSINKVSSSKGIQQETHFATFGNIEKEIVCKLIYITDEDDQVTLAWVTFISYLKPEFHEWKVYIDATSGKYIKKIDQVLHCDFGLREENCTNNHDHPKSTELNAGQSTMASAMTNMYNVFPYPLESPNHGNRSIVTDPADATASPYGWHDTDGVTGADYTITRGNNVHAQEDINGDNGSGSSPDGGASLILDYTLDFNETPSTNTPAAQNLNSSLTNLFYWNNIIHDVFYNYGFNEVSGNFQENNYGNGGLAGDYVLADGLDGSGTNNANFSSGNDGQNGRMQMFLWNNSGVVEMEVNAPVNVAGNYTVVGANFGATSYNVTADVVEVDDGSGAPSEGCGALTNGAAISGNVALIDRGSCEFGLKALNAQNAGAIAVIVCNNVAGAPIAMGPGVDGASVTIPAVMISQSDCATLRVELGSLNITMTGTTAAAQIDGSFDNGIVAHEYGHGISTRLTGGPSTSCLNNQEQSGEGWSDFFGLVLSHETGDTKLTARGIGTYALGQSTTGLGIRAFPYTTDMAINPSTYNTIQTAAVPHGVGSVFCTMLWDLYWDLIEVYGYDTDLYNGTGGNNIAIQLVIDGLKMQPCSPGFIDSRDAILAADRINNGGANQCLIWNAFARRGLGVSATQGSSSSSIDGTEAYDIPSGIEIFDEETTIELLEGEVIQFTSTATCECTAKSDVILKHTIPAGISIISVENGNQSGNEVSSNTVSLAPQETVTISYTARIDICNPISQDIIFEDDIEGADEFTSLLINVGGSWVKSSSPTNSGTNAWYAENLATETDFALTLNSQILLNNTSILTFFHRYSTEASWDGGVVEISIDNGTSWTDLGDKFIENGYQSTINVNPNSGISGQDAFTGSSDADFGTSNFVESKIDLSSFSGSSILIRFRFASDGAVSGTGLNGWLIDDVTIQELAIVELDKEVTVASVIELTKINKIVINKLIQNYLLVDVSATGSKHGGDWANAMTSLQDAIDLQACNDSITEIWVKSGVYTPSTSDINVSYNMATNSMIYGGFAGNETELSARNPAVFPTILSGNIGASSFSVHVISNNAITNALLDGFIIQDGNATPVLGSGGGVLNSGSTVTFRNCNFQNNKADTGGAISNIEDSNVILEDCMFFENTSTTNTARAINNSDSQLLLKNVTIIDPLMNGPGSTINNSNPNFPASQITTDGVVEVKEFE